MSGEATKEGDQHSADFMLAEYQRLMEAFQSVEESGERPVNFFVTVVTAVTGGFLVFFERGILGPWIVVIGLGVLLVFGVTTLVRIIKRNIASHEYLRAAGRIRAYFARDETIRDYLYYSPVDDRPFRKKEWHEILSVGSGGLVETVSLVNSLLVAGMLGLLAYFYNGILFGVVAAIEGAAGAWVGQFVYVKWRYEREERKEQPNIKFRG